MYSKRKFNTDKCYMGQRLLLLIVARAVLNHLFC